MCMCVRHGVRVCACVCDHHLSLLFLLHIPAFKKSLADLESDRGVGNPQNRTRTHAAQKHLQSPLLSSESQGNRDHKTQLLATGEVSLAGRVRHFSRTLGPGGIGVVMEPRGSTILS